MEENLFINPAIGTDIILSNGIDSIKLCVIGCDTDYCNGCFFYGNPKFECSKIMKNINCMNRIFVETA